MDKGYDFIKPIGKHSIYKFQLIQEYVSSWAEKLLNTKMCNEIVFIDCMCNCGEYIFEGKTVYGTPVRVANLLSVVAKKYPDKKITLYFNDFSKEKVDYLTHFLPQNTENFTIYLSSIDGNILIKKLGRRFKINTHYLLVYDPFEAKIDWDAIEPYINGWSEVILNHMVSDTRRAIRTVKREEAREKYEMTYQVDIRELISLASDKNAYEQRILSIIENIRNNPRPFYIASFPFFNSKNALEYNFIHCTSNKIGFRLFKTCAWKVFGGHSSNKNIYGKEDQYRFDFVDDASSFFEDSECYTVHNVVVYVYRNFKDANKVKLNNVWDFLYNHPIFPVDKFKNIIKNELKKEYGVKESKGFLIFRDEE